MSGAALQVEKIGKSRRRLQLRRATVSKLNLKNQSYYDYDNKVEPITFRSISRYRAQFTFVIDLPLLLTHIRG